LFSCSFIIEKRTTGESSTKQSTTSSYISDDCKVLYIETVIEVAKPIFYERTTDTLSTTNTEYHHQHIPDNKINTQRSLTSNRNKYLMDTDNNNHQGDSSDDDLTRNPVKLPTTTRHQLNEDHSKPPGDSGIEVDHTSSSSTINDEQINQHEPLFPPANTDFDEAPPQPSLLRHIQKHNALGNENFIKNPNQLSSTLTDSDTHWNRLQKTWFRSLFTGLLLLLILFLVYLSGLDTCSRSAIIHSVCHKIIRIESEGLPTI
jgi:hypothetical protein